MTTSRPCQRGGVFVHHSDDAFLGEVPIAKNQNTYAKRQREHEKKQRADEKRAKRDRKKDGTNVTTPSRILYPAEDRSPDT